MTNAAAKDRSTEALPRLPARNLAAHKGDFGRVLLVAGSSSMPGAAILAGRAALRSGVGLLTIATAASAQPIVAAGDPAYMTQPLPEDEEGRVGIAALEVVKRLLGQTQFDAIALGPGLGVTTATTDLLHWLWKTFDQPVVIDADALTALAGSHLVTRNADGQLTFLEAPAGPRVLTPHPGEFARLVGAKSPSENETRAEAAIELARRDSSGQTVVVLKGHRTIIAGQNAFAVNRTGGPELARGGTGDLLTGMLAALLGQGLTPFDAARLAVYVHGRCGTLAAESQSAIGLASSDLPSFLPLAWKEQESAGDA